MKSLIITLIICAISNATFGADRVSIKGALIPGGLVIGKATSGSKISIQGKPVRTSPDGVFVIGFGRDAHQDQTVTILDANGFTFSKNIKLKSRIYKVTRIDGLPESKVTPESIDVKRIKADNAGIAQVRKLDTEAQNFLTGFQWPTMGRISGVFGSQRVLNGKPRSPHNGIDIAAAEGASILATAAGTVALVHQDMFFSGKTVMIDHGHGLSSVYIHMKTISVKKGQLVSKSDQVGTVGMTGRATGPHLHFGISLFGTHLDPKLIVTGKTSVTSTY